MAWSGLHRDKVFIPGGQPSVTYIHREDAHVERMLARAISTPNQIVSVAGATKTGKTVLCKKLLESREFVWIDGGQINSVTEFWDLVCRELNFPLEQEVVELTEGVAGFSATAAVITASGSRLKSRSVATRTRIHSMADSLRRLVDDDIVLVIDDFHYLQKDDRTTLMRNVKGAVFNGLKVVLLSVTHRAFDVIEAETELTGRFAAIHIPPWTADELKKIPEAGFRALKVDCPTAILEALALEAQASPFLMQRFCWEMCYDCKIETNAVLLSHRIPEGYDLRALFIRIAQDAGLPVYQRLVTGPQSRKIRTKRPLRSGREADIYEVTLLAMAETGPKPTISYDELRTTMNGLVVSMMPRKHEITSALKHLAIISLKSGTQDAIDWNEDSRTVNVADPYLRFYLRWQIRSADSQVAMQ